MLTHQGCGISKEAAPRTSTGHRRAHTAQSGRRLQFTWWALPAAAEAGGAAPSPSAGKTHSPERPGTHSPGQGWRMLCHLVRKAAPSLQKCCIFSMQRAQPAAAEVGGAAPLPLAGESLPPQRPGTALPGRDSAGCTVQGGGLSPWCSVGNRCRPQLPCCPEDGSSFGQMEWDHRVCIARRTAERKPLSRESATHGPASATRGLPPGRTTLRLEGEGAP